MPQALGLWWCATLHTQAKLLLSGIVRLLLRLPGRRLASTVLHCSLQLCYRNSRNLVHEPKVG